MLIRMFAHMLKFLLPFLLIYYFVKKLQEARLKRLEENLDVNAGNNVEAQLPIPSGQHNSNRFPIDPNDIPPPPYTEREMSK